MAEYARAEVGHTFTASDADWGFSQMAPFREIEDPNSGFLVDGMLQASAPVLAPRHRVASDWPLVPQQGLGGWGFCLCEGIVCLSRAWKMHVRRSAEPNCTACWSDRGLCAAQLRVDIVVERLENAFYDSKRETGFVGLRNQVPRAHQNSGTPLRSLRCGIPVRTVCCPARVPWGGRPFISSHMPPGLHQPCI